MSEGEIGEPLPPFALQAGAHDAHVIFGSGPRTASHGMLVQLLCWPCHRLCCMFIKLSFGRRCELTTHMLTPQVLEDQKKEKRLGGHGKCSQDIEDAFA